ncbi:hypothetical protein [Streptomyces sp. NRRL S-350]|uniref:hypothetical protein n=1 Tax=Streptomyces sp. NRRL S-350 TaxID=1463902 RepID=UPI0004BEB240|nr:hypothetical protein [Streptomyces sp. NRRL S-350]
MGELEEWTCEYSGLVIGSPDSALSLAQVDGLLSLPDVRSSDLVLIQREGRWPGDDILDGRPVTLTIEVYGRTPEEFSTAWAALTAAFRVGRPELPFRFRFPGIAAGESAFIKARPRKRGGSIDLSFAYGVSTVPFELYATDPKIYAESSRKVRVSTRTGSPVFTQRGSVPARPIVEITDATNPVLTDELTGQTFGIAYTGSVTVDGVAQIVRSSAGEDITGLVTPGSVWPEYEAGNHRLKLVSENSDVEATAVATWREAWE